jgi:hypothetical protein
MPAQIKTGKKKIVKLILTIVTFYFIPNSNKSESLSSPRKKFPVEGTMLVRPTKAELSGFGEGGAKSNSVNDHNRLQARGNNRKSVHPAPRQSLI